MIYIIGHKSPDLDSVVSAIIYAIYKNKLNDVEEYLPCVAGELNKETVYILNKFGISFPEVLKTAESKNIILVDHNEKSQAVDGIEKANIAEVIDHHKVVFECSNPIKFQVEPWGATCTIIADLFFKNNFELSNAEAGLLLSAILVDTVITKSPTCTEKDKEIIEKLSVIADIVDWKKFGMEIFKVRASVSELSEKDIIKSDFKDFVFKAGKFGIGQVETVDLADFENRKIELLKELKNKKEKENYHSVVLFITDIIKEGSLFLVSSDESVKITEIFQVKTDNKEEFFVSGIISRKKQVAPKFDEVFNK